MSDNAPRDPDIDTLRDRLHGVCVQEGRHNAVAIARSHFDQAIHWLRVHRDRQRAQGDVAPTSEEQSAP